jgi:translation initiation factor 5
MNDLQNLIHKYIENFVLCKNCHLPETHYKIKGGDSISQKCVACGSKDLCDMTHKLTTFILKQHKKMKSEDKDKDHKKKDKKDKKSRHGEAASSAGAEESDEKVKKEKKSKKKKAAAAAVEDEEVIDETLEGDTESEALGTVSSFSSSFLSLCLSAVCLLCGDDECIDEDDLDLVCS